MIFEFYGGTRSAPNPVEMSLEVGNASSFLVQVMTAYMYRSLAEAQNDFNPTSKDEIRTADDYKFILACNIEYV